MTQRGAILGLATYRYICAKRNIEADSLSEAESIMLGSALGYGIMAFVVGPIWHQIAGVSDVKWGPFR